METLPGGDNNHRIPINYDVHYSSHLETLPLEISDLFRSFSQLEKLALTASVIFLLVPGVSGSTWVGISVTEKMTAH